MNLITAQDLVPLAHQKLGLRLTPHLNEVRWGGDGDAIPLSHLAGAKDMIEFVTLAFIPDLPRSRMEQIYHIYQQSDIESTDCMPRLILHYAAQHAIGDSKERLSIKKSKSFATELTPLNIEAIESEVNSLVSWYNCYHDILPLEYTVKETPALAEELAYNFNEKLQLRLALNGSTFATSDKMAYLFLTKTRYVRGYDFRHYPMGKVGRHEFNASDVLAHYPFSGGLHLTPEHDENLKEAVFNKIKLILQNESPTQIKRHAILDNFQWVMFIIMLLAGWGFKLLGCTHLVNRWISQAIEKLNRHATDQAYSNSM